MTFLPGWNSLEAVSRIERFFTVAGIVCLAALVFTEVCAYFYGQRDKFLTAQAQAAEESRIIQEHELNLQNTQQRYEQEITNLRGQIHDATQAETAAEAQIKQLIPKVTPRRLTEKQEDELSRAIGFLPDGSVQITGILGDQESCGFAEQLAKIFLAARKLNGGGIAQAVFRPPLPRGVVISIRSQSDSSEPIAARLQHVLAGIGISAEGSLDSGIPSGLITLTVGTKPNTEEFAGPN